MWKIASVQIDHPVGSNLFKVDKENIRTYGQNPARVNDKETKQ